MAAWSGFTDEDLRKMRSVSHEGDDEDRRGAPSKRGMARRTRGAAPRQKMDRSAAVAQSQHIRNDEKLSVDKSPEDALSKERRLSGDRTKNDATKNESVAESTTTPSPESATASQEKPAQSEVVELSTDQALNAERETVVKFQQQQKVIEEANKQKRALLSKAIEERRKMAKAEAQKLVKIQQELNHLDTLLNADVGIIRDKIEISSLDYAQAQKRYERAEKEFIEAKMDLYEKSEAKEKLTEHLYTIINQNEVRKAKKLVELMEQLAMQISPEEMEMSMPSIPHLTNFTAASTIHQPGHKIGHPQSDAETTNVVAEDGNCKVGKKKEGVASNSAADGCGDGVGDGKEQEAISGIKKEGESKESGSGKESSGDGEKYVVNATSNSENNNNTIIKTQPQSSEPNDNDPSKIGNEGVSGQQIVTASDGENVDSQVQNSSPHPASHTAVGSVINSEETATPSSLSQPSTDIPATSTTDPNGNPPSQDKDAPKAKGWSLPFT